jgi:hypothetical protein
MFCRMCALVHVANAVINHVMTIVYLQIVHPAVHDVSTHRRILQINNKYRHTHTNQVIVQYVHTIAIMV